jgi:hypothetical protein
MTASRVGRQRPHFEVQRWVRLGDGGEALAVTGPIPVGDPPSKAALDAPNKTPPEQESGVATVDPPSAKEVTGDEIPW